MAPSILRYLLLILITAHVITALCPEFDGKGIPTITTVHVAYSLVASNLEAALRIPPVLTQVSQELQEEFGIGLHIISFKQTSSDDCPGYTIEKKKIQIIWSQKYQCSTNSRRDEVDQENEDRTDPGFVYLIPHNEEFSDLASQFKQTIIDRYNLQRLKDNDCASVKTDYFLTDIIPQKTNGIVEGEEVCDTVINHKDLACRSGKIAADWEIGYTCPSLSSCRGKKPTITCKYNGASKKPEYCSTYINYTPTTNLAHDMCFNFSCNSSRMSWGILVPQDDDDDDDATGTFIPYDDAIKNTELYGCYLPDRTRTPVCYDALLMNRPPYRIVCGMNMLVDGVRQWYVFDDERCITKPKPVPQCTIDDVRKQYGLRGFPSCLGYLCAPDEAYETKDYEQYKSCSSDQTHGLSIASCEVNRGRITRHVGCYYIDQTDLETYPVYKEDTENTLCEALGEPPLDLYVSHCQYHWECPVNPEQPGPIPEPCEFCATQSCFDTVITTQPVCVWRWDGAYGKLDAATGRQWCSSDGQLPYEPPAVPKPPVKGHDCGELCIPMWGCFDSIEQEYVPCDSFDHDPYPCVPADEEAQCGAGVRKEGSISTTCMGLRSYGTHTPYEYFDTDEPCDGIALPAFECIVECETTWVCSTYAVAEGDTADGPTEGTQVEEIKSCTLASIRSSLNALSQCGTTQYYTTISCPDGITCDDRPPDFPSGTDRVSFSIDHAVTCGATCFDANKDTLQEGDDLDLNIHSRACDEWGVPLRKYDAEHLSTSDYTCAASGPCQEGVLRRGILCYDRITNKIVRVGTKDGDHGSPTFCRAVFERFHQQSFLSAWCTTYDPAVCATEHRCAFDYLEQFSPTGEPINSVQPFASKYHSFRSANCDISSWDPILDEYYAGLDDDDDDDDQNTKPRGLCGQMAQVDRCFIKPKTGGGGQGTWFPDTRLCSYPTLFSESSAVYALNKSDDETFTAYRSISYGQQTHHLNHFFMEGCARWRCSRTLDGNPTSTSYSTNYCFDKERICNITRDAPFAELDRCGYHYFNILNTCYYPDLTGEHGQKRLAGPLKPEDCRFLDSPLERVPCLYIDDCDSIRRECAFVSDDTTTVEFSRTVCQDACKTPLCGDYALTSACFAHSRETNESGRPARVALPKEYCDHPDDLVPLPNRCKNYLECTHWACGEWTSHINPEDIALGAVTLSDLDRTQCTAMPSESAKRALCSIPCGRGVIQRHVACVSKDVITHDSTTDTRCGLHYMPPIQTMSCETNPSRCSALHECNMSHLPMSNEMCLWSSSPDSCPELCDDMPHQPPKDQSQPYPIDIATRCVYRGVSSMLFAPGNKCSMDSSLSVPKSCPRENTACCSADANSFMQQSISPHAQQCSSVPDDTVVLADFRIGNRGERIQLKNNHVHRIQQQPQYLTSITLDDPYTAVQWTYQGAPAINTVSLFLLHPDLPFPYLIESIPVDAVKSFSYRALVTIESDAVPPLSHDTTPEPDPDEDEDEDDDQNKILDPSGDHPVDDRMMRFQSADRPTDPSHYATVLAYMSPSVFQTLDYVELRPNAAPIRLSNPPLSGVGSGYTVKYCGNQPCYNGSCAADSEETCQCYPGFVGRFCERYTLCVASTTCPPNAVAVPRQDDLSREWAYSPQDLPVSASPTTPQEYDAILATLSPPSTQCDQCQCIHQFFGENCDECGLMCSPSRGVPNTQCSACDCQEGFLGPQCNCRRVFLPIYHHRAPAFLERFFATAKRSSGRSSPATIAEAPTSIRREYTQWKRIVLNDVSLDLSYPVTSLDIADYGYHSSGGTTLFLVLVAVNTCENIPQRASAHTTLDTTDEEQLSYRAGNTTDLALASILLSEYTKPYENQEPTPPPSFLSIKPQSLGVFDIKEDPGEWEEDEGNTTSTSSSVVAIGKIFEPLADHLSQWQSLASEPPAAVVDQAHRTLSAPLILQAVHHTPSHIATGVSHAMGSGFVRVGRVIDPYCETTGQPVCYSTSEMPRLKKMPYGPASKRAPPVTLILILVFCVALPLIVLLLVILYCWWKSIYLFKPREAKEAESDDGSEGRSIHSKTSRSEAEMTDYTTKRGNTRSKQGTYSMTTASTPHQLEDPDLHPDWKKVMGPAGEPIYINDTTLKSSKVRPLADGTIPSQKSMFHRPTVFTK